MPADVTVDCRAVPAPAAVTASDACDPAPALSFGEVRVDGPCAGTYLLLRTWTATDRCANVASAVQRVSVRDTTPPVVEPGSGGSHCLWPPNHKHVRFDAADFAPIIADDCSPPIGWRFHGCASNQPDDARETDATSPYNGDGHTVDDCIVAPDGSWFSVRAERAGTGPDAKDGRTYTVTIIATDACGNASAPTAIGAVRVSHDQRHHDTGCRRGTTGNR